MLADDALVAVVGDVTESDPSGLLGAIADVADPDQALLVLARIAGVVCQHPDQRAVLADLLGRGPGRDRLLAVVGASVALGDMLAAHLPAERLGPAMEMFMGDHAPHEWPIQRPEVEDLGIAVAPAASKWATMVDAYRGRRW